jgi:hypothetical protein
MCFLRHLLTLYSVFFFLILFFYSKREVNKKVLKVPSIEQKVKSSLALFENVKALSGVEPIHFDVIM